MIERIDEIGSSASPGLTKNQIEILRCYGATRKTAVAHVPGLYFIGRSWQWTRGSALFAGVGEDAAYLTEHIVKQLDHREVA
jgi:hypothetical protein